MSLLQPDLMPMVAESQAAIQSIRHSLIELYASVSIDPQSPKEVAQVLGLNRILTWKLHRVISAEMPFLALNYLPSTSGIELAISAFRKFGAPAEKAAAVRSAMMQFDLVIERHAGTREQLELTLESLGIFQRDTGTESGWEQAFRGNSMIWGVQVKTRLATAFLAPSGTEPGKNDWVIIAGLFGFRRLRPSARWRLFRLQIYDDQGNTLKGVSPPEEIEPKQRGDTPMILREFCSAAMPGIELVAGPEGTEFILPGGEIGNAGAFDCVSGYIVRGLPAYRSPGDDYGSAGAQLTVPIDTLVCDIIVHKDVYMPNHPEMLVYGFPHGGVDSPAAQTVQNLLPIRETMVELPGSPPAVATPLVPRYGQIVARVMDRMCWTPASFRGLRMIMRHPPFSSRVVLRWPLRDKPL